MSSPIDHLVWAGPDLFAAVADFEKLTGIAPVPGGQHLGLGTRNFLVRLGETSYLEILGPDPQQDAPSRPRPFGLDHLTENRLVAWAIGVRGIEERVAAAREAGWDPGRIVSMSRRKPEGVLLEWQLTMRRHETAAEPVPFLIDWGETTTPAETAAPGAELVELVAMAPDEGALERHLRVLGAPAKVGHAMEPRLRAHLQTPSGDVTLS
ncbi:MAG: VOC family protein [Acidobacteriota bacterium]